MTYRFNKSNIPLCDDALSGWYRFSGEAGNKMPESCVPIQHCNTRGPGWLNGSHPAVADGPVRRKVCFHSSRGKCCSHSNYIIVRNCGGFFVYKLHRPPSCDLRYCGNRVKPTSGRNSFFLKGYLSDNNLGEKKTAPMIMWK